MAHRLRSFWAAFWRVIDGDSVRPWVFMYYTPLLLFSVFAAVTLAVIGDHLVVAGLPILLWMWVQAVATTAAMGGLLLRHGGTSVADLSRWLLRRDWLGLCLQAAGHAVMCLMLAEFEVAVIQFLASGVLPIRSLVWWLLAYGAAALTAYVTGTFGLTLQCLRKLDKGRKLQAEA